MSFTSFGPSLSESSGDVTAPPSASSNENRPEEDVFWSSMVQSLISNLILNIHYYHVIEYLISQCHAAHLLCRYL